MVARAGTVVAPAVTAYAAAAPAPGAAAPACTVEYTVTSQWDAGFQGGVTITNNRAALNGWPLTFEDCATGPA